ncbi:MAG: endo-1,4-beta-xylanase, partial [Oscillospiraceae bacterium]|nr:endo-1,4-beta-xylanase [Oscillospiraceae bacterium]
DDIEITAAEGGESLLDRYASDFSAGTDGWVARSAGTASVAVTEEGALRIEGRQATWNSPGREFPLTAGETYLLSVRVRQDEKASAEFILSVAHSRDGRESYENLAFGTAKQGEWTELSASYTAGPFDRYILYVETHNSGTLSFEIRDFRLTRKTADAFGAEGIPSLKEAYAGVFDFGAAVTLPEVFSKPRMAFCAEQFAILTPGNEMKPDALIDVNASRRLAAEDEGAVALDFTACKPLLDFAKANGVKVHGHTFVWHQQTPEAFFHEGYDPAKPLVTREVMLTRLERMMRGTFEYLEANYPGVVVSYDVLNEAVDDSTGRLRASNWLKVVGEDYPERAFELARACAPAGVRLFYNDYNTAFAAKQNGIVKLLETVMATGCIDGYGFQMHHDLAMPSVAAIRASVDRIAALGLRLLVSELDITIPDGSEATLEKQADMYRAVMEILLAHAEQVDAVQVWGVTDELSWRAQGRPLLFGAGGEPKPAFLAVIEAAQGR